MRSGEADVTFVGLSLNSTIVIKTNPHKSWSEYLNNGGTVLGHRTFNEIGQRHHSQAKQVLCGSYAKFHTNLSMLTVVGLPTVESFQIQY